MSPSLWFNKLTRQKMKMTLDLIPRNLSPRSNFNPRFNLRRFQPLS